MHKIFKVQGNPAKIGKPFQVHDSEEKATSPDALEADLTDDTQTEANHDHSDLAYNSTATDEHDDHVSEEKKPEEKKPEKKSSAERKTPSGERKTDKPPKAILTKLKAEIAKIQKDNSPDAPTTDAPAVPSSSEPPVKPTTKSPKNSAVSNQISLLVPFISLLLIMSI